MTTRVMRASALVGVALALLAHGVGVAQPKPSMPRVGYLSPASSSDPRIAPFRQGLADLGWVEGRTIAIEYRWADERYERLSGLAAELIRLNVDVIVAWGPAIQAARHATSSIPIVMASTIDAVGSGFVASLAHPGSNVTGLTMISSELMGKRLELLKQCLPRLARLAMLTGPPGAGTAVLTKAAEDAARRLGLALEVREVRDGADLDPAFAAIARSRAGAVYVMESPVLHANRARILDLASARRLPTFGVRAFVEGGGLMSYGPEFRDLHRRAARFVDRILKGASPATLPVEQPTKFELVINMRTARALGLTIPPPVLLQADHVIE